jgi:CBS domain-containing protein
MFPVVEASQQLVGMITQHALREAILDRGALADVLVAEDLAEPSEALTAQQSLREALSIMNARGLDALLVTGATMTQETPARFVGLITRADILQAYEHAMSRTV